MSRRQIDEMVSFPVFRRHFKFQCEQKCGKSVFNTLIKHFRRNINKKIVDSQSFV